MTLYRYRRWDGAQEGFDMRAGDLFEGLSDYLMEGWSPDEAYQWILKQGIRGQESRIMGIEDLRSRIASYRQSLYDSASVKKALRNLRDELTQIIERELESLRKKYPEGSDVLRRKEEFLSSIQSKLSLALDDLYEYEFADREAKMRYDSIDALLDKIKKAEWFVKRYGERFTGEDELDFEELLELMERLNQLERIEKLLASGNLEDIDPDDMKDVLNPDGVNSLTLLKGLKSELEKSGLIMTRGDRTELTPKGIRKLGETALSDIFSSLDRKKLSEHETGQRGTGSARPEETKQYEFGDPFNLDIVNTLKKSLAREAGGNGLRIEPGDFEVYDTEYHTHASTALLLDLSWSMSFQGRFPAAKRVALALDHLIRTNYPRDELYIIGFSTGARRLTTPELAVTAWDSNDPFTNIQEALSAAAKLLSRQRSSNRQIILITDGQPTAYYMDGYLQVELPMFFGGLSPRATFETLKEVKRVTGMGIKINTFMLDDSPSLRRFVEEMTRINKGRAFFTTPSQLGKYLLVDYLKRKKKVL